MMWPLNASEIKGGIETQNDISLKLLNENLITCAPMLFL